MFYTLKIKLDQSENITRIAVAVQVAKNVLTSCIKKLQRVFFFKVVSFLVRVAIRELIKN